MITLTENNCDVFEGAPMPLIAQQRSVERPYISKLFFQQRRSNQFSYFVRALTRYAFRLDNVCSTVWLENTLTKRCGSLTLVRHTSSSACLLDRHMVDIFELLVIYEFTLLVGSILHILFITYQRTSRATMRRRKGCKSKLFAMSEMF